MPFTRNNVVNLFIVYELDIWSKDLNIEIHSKDCLFGAVKMYIMVVIFNSIHVHDFHCLMVAWEKLSLSLELI